jgi:hypothetical protein
MIDKTAKLPRAIPVPGEILRNKIQNVLVVRYLLKLRIIHQEYNYLVLNMYRIPPECGTGTE